MDTTHKLVSDTPGSLREDDLTAVQGTADVKENTHDQMANETASLKSADKTQTRFIVATSLSDSHEDSYLTPVKDEANARCFVPFWALVFCVMTFFGLMCSFALRVGLSVAIVAMVNQTAVTEDVEMSNATNTSGTDQCPRDPALQHTDADGEFTWNRHQQATALAAYYYGYIMTPVCGNKHCRRLILAQWPTLLKTQKPAGTAVGHGPGDIVLYRDLAPPTEKGSTAPPLFGPCLLWPNGRPSQQLLSSCRV